MRLRVAYAARIETIISIEEQRVVIDPYPMRGLAIVASLSIMVEEIG
jgi:hypothetical protein